MFCHNCQTEISLAVKPRRNDTCPKCLAYVHCCKNCRFYDPGAHNQCHEPQAEWVKDKEAGNYCDYFEPNDSAPDGKDTRKEEALKKLNELFKK